MGGMYEVAGLSLSSFLVRVCAFVLLVLIGRGGQGHGFLPGSPFRATKEVCVHHVGFKRFSRLSYFELGSYGLGQLVVAATVDLSRSLYFLRFPVVLTTFFLFTSVVPRWCHTPRCTLVWFVTRPVSPPQCCDICR